MKLDPSLWTRPVLPVCGIYFLLQGREVVYVGKARNVVWRVWNHFNEGEKTFDGYSYVECGESELAECETNLIRLYTPIYNVTFPPSSQWVTLDNLASITGKTRSDIRRILASKAVAIETRGRWQIVSRRNAMLYLQ